MKTVYYDTEEAIFRFQANDILEHLNDPLNGFDDEATANLMKIICTDSEESIETAAEQELFGYTALSLLEKGKGAVTCKACNKTFDAGQLKSVLLGAGKSPLDVKGKPEGGPRNRFQPGKRRNPSMIAGQGFECPKRHRLIAMITWRT